MHSLPKSLLKFSLAVLLSFFLSVFAFGKTVSAYTFKKDIATNVEVKSRDSVFVSQKVTLSWDDPKHYFPSANNSVGIYISPALIIKDDDIDSKISNLRVTDKFGKNISFKRTKEEGSILIEAPYYADLQKYSNLEFNISFNTSLYISDEGGVIELQYPGLSEEFKAIDKDPNDEYTVQQSRTLKLIVPESFGSISLVSPEGIFPEIKNETSTVTLSTSDMVGKSARVAVGSERTIKFTIKGNTVSTNTNSPDFIKNILVNYIDVALPSTRAGTEFANQEIYFSKIQPFPESLSIDEDGNLIARLPVQASTNGEILIEGYAVISQLKFPDAVKEVLFSEIPDSMNKYVEEESRYWQTTATPIVELANKQKDSNDFVFNSLKNSLEQVVKSLTYPEISSADDLVRKGAIAALESGSGVCMEYSDLLLSVLRAQGIPTRTVYGAGVETRIDRTLDGIGHQWVGAWFPEAGWIPVDPTWSDQGYEYIGHDFDHFTWYVASKSVNEPSGFDCFSSDLDNPCREALEIYTEPVSEIPNIENLLTIDELTTNVLKQELEMTPVQRSMQEAVSYLGGSSIGRLLLSTQGLIILSALFTYIFLVLIISAIGKSVRKRKAKRLEPLPSRDTSSQV